MLSNYGVNTECLTLYRDNMSAINISKNLVQHSRTKHIDISHHFIRELVEQKIINIQNVSTKTQLTDIFTKAKTTSHFEGLRYALGICCL